MTKRKKPSAAKAEPAANAPASEQKDWREHIPAALRNIGTTWAPIEAHPAQAAQKRYHDAHPEQGAEAHSPFAQWGGSLCVESERAAIEGGDGFALLACIAECARVGVPLPDWLGREFTRAFERVLNREVGSWDAAFGPPVPKGKHLDSLRKAREKRHSVWMAVRWAREADPRISLDAGLFEVVGKKFGIGKTLAEQYYRESEESLTLNRDPMNRRLKFDK